MVDVFSSPLRRVELGGSVSQVFHFHIIPHVSHPTTQNTKTNTETNNKFRNKKSPMLVTQQHKIQKQITNSETKNPPCKSPNNTKYKNKCRKKNKKQKIPNVSKWFVPSKWFWLPVRINVRKRTHSPYFQTAASLE